MAFLDDDGGIEVHDSLLNVVLQGRPQIGN